MKIPGFKILFTLAQLYWRKWRQYWRLFEILYVLHSRGMIRVVNLGGWAVAIKWNIGGHKFWVHYWTGLRRSQRPRVECSHISFRIALNYIPKFKLRYIISINLKTKIEFNKQFDRIIPKCKDNLIYLFWSAKTHSRNGNWKNNADWAGKVASVLRHNSK